MNRRRFFACVAATSALAAVGCGQARSPRRFPVAKSAAEWRTELGAARYAVLREAATERPFSSALNGEKRAGSYHCAGCAQALFSSRNKYDSGTGWPSFWRALPKATLSETDYKLGYARTESLCSRCGGHLGHVFDDGPPPTGERHCINGLALRFKPETR